MFGGMSSALKIADVLDKLINDSGLRKKFEETGRVAGRIQIEEYDIYIDVRRKE